MRYFYDSTYILVLIGAFISMIASARVSSTFKRYSKIGNARGMTAEAVASAILQANGIFDVRIERIRGDLTDHYSPNEKVLRLSDSVYGSTSVAAIGVAAHECGHAIQHQVGYGPLKLRSASVPIANIGSKLSWPTIVLGLIFGSNLFGHFMLELGIVLFIFVVLFQIITLPVEFDASHRALKILTERNILESGEVSSARKVLKAAAMTYVAAAFSAILQLLRLVLLARRRS